MSYVYFIQSGSGPIKIGWSENPEKRLVELQTSHHEVLTLLGSRPGTREDEAALHARFAGLRIRGEWFNAHDQLIAEARRPTGPDITSDLTGRWVWFKGHEGAEFVGNGYLVRFRIKCKCESPELTMQIEHVEGVETSDQPHPNTHPYGSEQWRAWWEHQLMFAAQWDRSRLAL